MPPKPSQSERVEYPSPNECLIASLPYNTALLTPQQQRKPKLWDLCFIRSPLIGVIGISMLLLVFDFVFVHLPLLLLRCCARDEADSAASTSHGGQECDWAGIRANYSRDAVAQMEHDVNPPCHVLSLRSFPFSELTDFVRCRL